ncbi:DUF4124 domain-containing protein [Thalassotalea litorea]|uniref:DUF4124 domain-containing protein n=1 Tax=Thalassotalea litorea TaxID=2020715 RepID=A0A5R9IJH6_9GAMM|nr:DUF4124 domain-containing protein [Thalassotalea litorea]TLU61437.1 DUF4124 domain-containing protein [Thalassotalea litorea]
MDRRIVLIPALMLLGSIAIQANAKDVTVYRWVDENGNIHYTQHEPIDNEYAEVKIETPYNKAKPSLMDKSIDTSVSQKVASAKLANQAAEKCANAKNNLRVLNDFPKVKVTEEDGSTRLLTPVEKQQQLRIAENEVEVYCD